MAMSNEPVVPVVFELPPREAMSLLDPISGQLLTYASQAQASPPTDQTAATSNPLLSQGLGAVGGASDGASVQNVNSPNSVGSANVTR